MPRGHGQPHEDTDITESENTYERMPKKYLDKPLHYPNEDKLKIKLTFRMVITGETGSGKTNVCAQIFRKMGCFTKVLLFAKDLEEPIYKYLVDTIHEVEKETGLEVLKSSNDIDDLPDVNKLSKKDNTLVIIDDMVNEKSRQLAKVTSYYTKGRHFNASTIFLTQTYFGTPGDIRKNSGYFVFTKLSTNRDFRRIGRDFESTQDEDIMDKMFQIAVRDKGGFPHFLLIDVASNDPALLFRADFKPIPWSPPDPVSGKEAVIGITQELTGTKPEEEKEKSTDTSGSGMSGKRARTDPSSSNLKVDEQESSDEVEDGGGVRKKRQRKGASKKKPAAKEDKKQKAKSPGKRVPSNPKRRGKKVGITPTQVVISNQHIAGYTSREHEGTNTAPLRDRKALVQSEIDDIMSKLSSEMHDDDTTSLRERLSRLQAELLLINHKLARINGLGLPLVKPKRRMAGAGIITFPPSFYSVKDPMQAIRNARAMVTKMKAQGQIS